MKKASESKRGFDGGAAAFSSAMPEAAEPHRFSATGISYVAFRPDDPIVPLSTFLCVVLVVLGVSGLAVLAAVFADRVISLRSFSIGAELLIIGVAAAVIAARKMSRLTVRRMVDEAIASSAVQSSLGSVETRRCDRLQRALAAADLLSPVTALNEFVRCSAEHGDVAWAMRIVGTDDPEPLTPLDVSFEPFPLSEAEETFYNLSARGVHVKESGGTQEPESQYQRNVGRLVKLIGGRLTVVAMPVGFGMMLVTLVLSGMKPVRNPGVYTPLFALLLVATTLAFRVSANKRWLVVPGGIVHCRGSLFGRHRRFQFFDRKSSILVVHSLGDIFTRIVVATNRECRVARVTAAEAHFLLRAWLTTVPTTRVDQLTDLQ